jgi:hypothetical protein
MRRHSLGERDRFARRHDRQQKIRPHKRGIIQPRHAGGFGALRARRAAAR